MQAIANNFAPIAAVVPYFLDAVNLAHRVMGPKPLEWISSKLNVWSGKYIPEWNPYMPAVRLHACLLSSRESSNPLSSPAGCCMPGISHLIQLEWVPASDVSIELINEPWHIFQLFCSCVRHKLCTEHLVPPDPCGGSLCVSGYWCCEIWDKGWLARACGVLLLRCNMTPSHQRALAV